VIIVENPELRAQLREKSYGQGQITDASHLFVFAAQNTTTNADIDALINLTAETRGMNAADLAGYGDYMKGAISYLSDEQKAIWNAKQAYIGLGILLTQAASLKIDATPMEGFEPKEYDELLGLYAYHPVVVAAMDYRHADDGLQHAAKVRKSEENMFEAALEAGADEVDSSNEIHAIITKPENFSSTRDLLIEKFGDPLSAKLDWKAKVTNEISDLEQAQKLMKMIDALEDCDDVQMVTGNYNFSNEIAEKL
jgi:nitroreductase